MKITCFTKNTTCKCYECEGWFNSYKGAKVEINNSQIYLCSRCIDNLIQLLSNYNEIGEN